MCEIHGKKLDHFCLHHEDYFCRKCKVSAHEVAPCECLTVREVYFRLQPELEEAGQELVRLRERGRRILDGSYQRSLLSRVGDEEGHLDRFYKDMKRKFREAKAKVEAFTAEDLSEESRRALQQFTARGAPDKFRPQDTPTHALQLMKAMKKQTSQANSLLYGLSNYVELSIDPKFMNILAYSGDPVVIRGRPKYIAPVESEDEDWSLQNELEDLAYDKDENDNGRFYPTTMPKKGVTNRTFDVTSPVQTSAIHWINNVPTFPASKTKPANEAVKTHRPKNKYEKQIRQVKERLNLPPISLTPQPVKNLRATRVGARSLPGKPEPDDHVTNPVEKLFVKHSSMTRFVVKERRQVPGCEDAVVLGNCVLLSLGDRVQKRDKTTLQLLVALRLASTANMAVLHARPTQAALIQTDKCITIMETISGLAVIYKIKIKQPYTEICHIGTTDTGPYHPSYVFAAMYKGYPNRPTNCVDIIEAKETRKPGRPPMFDILAEEVNLTNHGYEVKEIFGISGFADGHVLLGTGEGVLCVGRGGALVWRAGTRREVSGLLTTRSLTYACMQDQRRVVCLNKAGFMTDEDVVPGLDIIPCRLSANRNILLVKDFKTKTWISFVFKHGLFIV